MNETIFDELRAEHEEMRQMMQRLTHTFNHGRFREFAEELEMHQEAEEEVLYDRIRDDAGAHPLVLEGIEEHALAISLLRKLQRVDEGTELWTTRMKVLSESVEHHLKEEENELFAEADRIIGRDEAVRMAKEFETAKKRVKTTA